MNDLKVLIVDDHNLIAEAWEGILQSEDHISVVGKAKGEDEGVDLAIETRPDVVLMDIKLAQGDGFGCTSRISTQLPKVKIIGLSIHDDLAIVKKLFKNGASGYLTKNSSTDVLLEAIQAVVKGDEFICREIKEKYFEKLMNGSNSEEELTEREHDIVRLVALGKTSKEIGEELHVSNRTVDSHRHRIFKKLNINNTAQLVIWAKNKGVI